MNRADRWLSVGSVAGVGIWVVLGWIVMDSDLQGVQEALTNWGIAGLALVPLLLMPAIAFFADEPGNGEAVAWADDDQPSRQCGGACGGCGG
ncbi:hypothetical protein EDD96_2875 [Streptomyces sp. Ag109_G2-6]|uniref:hypothetical protein n=1 Tax=Streptomyces TaxID=1883 RepID=UPI000F4D423A|nr:MULTISPECIES: hypothetical protein [Streptomyces]RPF46304.1 hypothetical protein EDD96_2875 [Streptomyces sp. Ag109_G2-6]